MGMPDNVRAGDLQDRFRALFKGNDASYGQYLQLASGEKRPMTEHGRTPESAWRNHLAGTGPYLGQVPICAGNVCSFGAIDVDDDNADHAKVARGIEKAKLPLIVCRSKSGGAHLYLFLADTIDAGQLQDLLTDFAEKLSLKNPNGLPVEIFPKQRIASASGGNWINLPYYGGDTSERYAVNGKGERLNLATFIETAESLRLSADQLQRHLNPYQAKGPPCLATLHRVGVVPGSRNQALVNMGIYYKLADPDRWEEEVIRYNGSFPEPLPESEVASVISSLRKTEYAYTCKQLPISAHCERKKCQKQIHGIRAAQAGSREAPVSEWTDTRNAERFAADHAADLRFCEARARWFMFDGKRWEPDDTRRVFRLAQEHADSVTTRLITELTEVSGHEREALLERIRGSQQLQQRPKVLHFVEFAKSREPIAVRGAQLDSDPLLLNCTNGTLDLKTGTLRPHDRRDLLTKMSGVAFDEKAACPRWEQFVQEITCGDEAYARLLQRAVGVSLTGITTDQKFYMCVGGGSNGKSVFLETIRDVLNDYAITSNFNTFLKNASGSGGGARSDLVRLAGARFVTSSEAPEGRHFDEQVLKNITGGERIACRALYANEMEYEPQFKLWLATNYAPEVEGGDDGIWRRTMVLPFNFKVDETTRDTALRLKLRNELPGILIWAIRGLEMWRAERGVGSCDVVRSATAVYREDQDLLRDFLEECVENDVASEIKGPNLFDIYHHWCIAQSQSPLKRKKLTKELKQKGWKQSGGEGRPWVGKRLRAGAGGKNF